MRKSEILPPTPSNICTPPIRPLLIRTHLIPFRILLPIPNHIVNLRSQERPNTQTIDDNQVFVTSMVKWLVVRSVDESRDDRAELDHHVVEGGRDRASADVIAVSRGPGYEDGVAVWVGEEDGGEGKCTPISISMHD